MRFLLDQDVYAIIAKFLLDTGHDVVLVADLGRSQASNEEILRIAQVENCILVTRDRDYGNLVFGSSFIPGVANNLQSRVLPRSLMTQLFGRIVRA